MFIRTIGSCPAFLQGDVGDRTQIGFRIQDRVLIQFGLVLLIATPIVRVAFTSVAFALQRDIIYLLVTLIVLALVVYSLTGGSR